MRYPWFVITGAPSSGKTTLINALQQKGYHTRSEAARALRVSSPVEESQEWEQQILRHKIKDHLEAPRDQAVFFDRGIPDSIAYYRFYQYEYDPLLRHSLQYAQYQAVFLLDPLPYVKDGMRDDYVAHVTRMHRLLKEAYHDLGLPVIQIAAATPQERVNLITKEVSTSIPIAHLSHLPIFASP